jgi:hypothetical protein
LLAARLRNGDAIAGSKVLGRSQHFPPATRDTWLESLIKHAQAHHGPRLVTDLRSLLTADGQDNSIRGGAFCLAGYLGEPCLADAVRCGWDKATDRRAILLPALWAGLRCAGEAVAEVLGPMMPLILELPDDDSDHGLTERNSLLEELGHATRHGVSEPVLLYLDDLARKDERYRWIVAALLDEIDHPIAIGYVVPMLAAAQHKAEESGGFSFWASHWDRGWRRRGEEAGIPLSDASLAELRSLWDNENGPEWLKNYAFGSWAYLVRNVSLLQTIPTTSPHFEDALWQRALLGDEQAIPHVLEKLTERRHWFRVINVRARRIT